MSTKEESFDIFIAYHGDDKTGTQGIAALIYQAINGIQIANKKIRAFFKPESLPHGDFADTPRIVARTPLFLLVVNKNIPKNAHGQILEREEKNGNLKYLYQEVKAFRESEFYKKAPKGIAAKLLLCDDFSFEEANKLDPIFAGTEAFQYEADDAIEHIIDWIRVAICNEETSPEINSSVKIDWTKERAKTWHKMQPPSRPATSELEIYQRFFENVKRIKTGAGKPQALILGSTVEFRTLAAREGFEITVVDYSREYYTEISKELPEDYSVQVEHYVECDWCNMSVRLVPKKFDIIIGDLSVGNVSPENIQKFYENIHCLLAEKGYLLGKSLYVFSNYSISAEHLGNLLSKNCADNMINKGNFYSYTMFPLSIFASVPYSYNDSSVESYKINFQELYKYIDQYVANLTENEYKEKFSIYLDEITQFDKKMPKDFYIYSYSSLITQLAECELYIEDIIYSKEVYKNDFPLLVIRKGQDFVRGNISVNTLLGRIRLEYWEIWRSALSSKYFLYNIGGYISDDELLQHVIQLLNNATIVLDRNLNYSLSKIPEQIMQEETQILAANTSIDNSERLKDALQFNYTCGVLSNILFRCKNAFKINASALDLVLRTLFAHRGQRGKLWKPYESPWVSARICICLFPIYEQWKMKKKRTQEEERYIGILEEVVILLAEKEIESSNLFWESETGSRFDTSALCIETLFLYSKYIKNENLKWKITAILDRYVALNHIKETFIKFPIFDDLIGEVCANQKVNGKPAYKKLCGRIEWYTILYLICRDWGNAGKNADLISMSDYIVNQLKRFWGIFVEKADQIIERTVNQEKSIVPQILYCLKRTELFD